MASTNSPPSLNLSQSLAKLHLSNGVSANDDVCLDKAWGQVPDPEQSQGKERQRQKKKYFKIDLHTHILPKHWPNLEKKYGYGGWLQLEHFEQGKARMIQNGKNFRTIECNCWSAPDRLPEMAATGVNVQVLSTVPVMFSYHAKPQDTLDLARYLNDHIAQTCAEDPKHFVGLGTLPMQDPSLAIVELRRCMQELGLRGIQIGSHINEWNLDAPELEPFWAECEALDVAVFVHPWGMENRGRMEKFWFPWLIGMPCETTVAICSLVMGGVLERYPRLKVCFAHGGGSFPATLGRIAHGFAVRPDLCATRTTRSPLEFLDRIYVDSLVHDPDALQLLVKKFGVERIMLGSDYPFPLGEHVPGSLVEEECDEFLGDKEKEMILSGNARRFLGLDEDYEDDLADNA